MNFSNGFCARTSPESGSALCSSPPFVQLPWQNMHWNVICDTRVPLSDISLISISVWAACFENTYSGSSLENNCVLVYSKGKAVPLQAWTGPDGSRKLRLPDFVTAAQDGGKVVSLRHRPLLPPGNTPGTHFCSRLSGPQGHSVIGRILCQWKIHWHQLGSNQRPSDL